MNEKVDILFMLKIDIELEDWVYLKLVQFCLNWKPAKPIQISINLLWTDYKLSKLLNNQRLHRQNPIILTSNGYWSTLYSTDVQNVVAPIDFFYVGKQQIRISITSPKFPRLTERLIKEKGKLCSGFCYYILLLCYVGAHHCSICLH